MDGYIVGSMISANSIVGEQIQANTIKATNLEIDVQKKIESATDEETVKTLIKADLDGFEVNVSNTYETKADSASKFDDVNNSISTLTGRISSAESKITDNAITNVVKQNFYTKEETNNQITSKGYQTSSQVQQMVDNLQVKFTQSGGYNMLYNAGFENGMTYWSTNGSPSIKENQSDQNYSGKSLFISANVKNQGIYQRFSCVIGKTYSYSFYAQAEYCQWYAGIEGVKVTDISVSPNYWYHYEGSFTATSNSHVFVIYSHGVGNLYIDNIMLCEGNLPSVYTPHPSEIYDGITTINKDGITIEHSNNNLVSKYTNNGMAIVDKGNNYDLLIADSDGVSVRGGRFVVADPNNGHTRLWGRDIIINDQRALVGTNSKPESPLMANKLYVNYSGDFKNGVEITGYVTNNNLPIVTLAGIQSATTGYASINNGFILQWGRITGLYLSSGSCKTTITFPISFPSICATCNVNVVSVDGAQDLATNYTASVKVNSNSNATLVLRDVTGKNYGSKIDISFFAIGV